MAEAKNDAPAGLIDLLQPRLGSEAVFANDDFFAPKERLINPEEPVFIPGKYDDHGKWMDGWESRRKRVPGHDFCIVRLGRPGIVHALDIDTRNFTGNYPPRASVDCIVSDERVPGEDASWRPIVPMMDLKGDSRHPIDVPSPQYVTHLRLNIFPDGGVARLRAYGRVTPPWRDKPSERVDLGAMENGAVPIYANNEHFGRLANLTAPGGAANMGDGWETRRRREPGYDWGVIELASSGTIEEITVDTSFFKGNYPDRCFIQAAPTRELSRDALIAESESWPIILGEQQLNANAKHVFKEVLPHQPVAYVRLNIIPDGGVARLRLLGRVA